MGSVCSFLVFFYAPILVEWFVTGFLFCFELSILGWYPFTFLLERMLCLFMGLSKEGYDMEYYGSKAFSSSLS